MWSFPNSFWEAPFCGWGVRKPTPEACLSVPSLSSPGAFLRGPGSPCSWPGPALWGGMQLHSDIPVAAQTQWHFVKSWATPSPLSVCWCCRGNQIPSLYVPHSLPAPVSSITNTSIVGLLRSLLGCQGTESLQSEDQNIFPHLVPKRDCLEGLEV